MPDRACVGEQLAFFFVFPYRIVVLARVEVVISEVRDR